MSSDAARFAQERWEEEGRRVASALDGVAGAVVVGTDPDAAAAVALGIGRAQATRRRVAIGDLVGEVGPLQSLVRGDDPHGIVDSFLYGVSLNRIARPIDGVGNLFVLPSGSEPIDAEEIFRSDRWARLATGFRDVGALLLLVVPSGVAGVEALVARVQGVVLAGHDTPAPAGAEVLAVAEPPSLEVPLADAPTEELAVAPVPEESAHDASALTESAPVESGVVDMSGDADAGPTDEGEPSAPLSDATAEAPSDAGTETTTTRARPATRWVRRIAEAPPTHVNLQAVSAHRRPDAGRAPEEDWAPPRRRRWPYALAAGLVVAAAGATWLARGGDSRSDAGRRAATASAVASADSVPSVAENDSGATAPAVPVAGGAATAAGEVAATPSTSAAAEPPAAPRFAVRNPADSLSAAAYAVQIVAANTVDGARAKLRDVALGLPAAVISPMSLGADSTRWYRLTVGAFSDRQSAIAYLTQLRRTRKIDVDAENVVRLPYALLLDGRVPRSMAKATASNYVARGLPAYALAQGDGTARVYAGAFETPEQAELLADLLSTAGIEPVVAYRTGRGF